MNELFKYNVGRLECIYVAYCLVIGWADPPRQIRDLLSKVKYTRVVSSQLLSRPLILEGWLVQIQIALVMKMTVAMIQYATSHIEC